MNFAFRTQRPGGAIGWIEAHAKPSVTVPAGQRRVVGVMKDITARREVEERLRQAAAVFQTTAEGIFLLDREHRIVSVNPAFTVITGYRPDEVLGQDPAVLLHVRRHSDQFYRRLETNPGGHWQGETYCRHKNGTVFPICENVSVVRDEGGAAGHYVVAFSDISAMRRAEAQLDHLTHHDPLTGLPNRLLFNDRLEQTLARARREEGRCAVLFFDLDGFKVINDTLGHSSGDLLLQTIAARLKRGLRSNDTAARLGGDEFVVLLDHVAKSEDAARIAGKLLEALALPVELGAEPVGVSASAGISVYPDNGRSRDALLKAADTAMYSAKAQGRNRYCFYTEDLAARAAERLTIEQGLRGALATESLVLHYQPAGGIERRRPHGGRGAATLAASQARPDHAGSLHRHRRGERDHRAARSLGVVHGLRAGRGTAPRWRTAIPALRQRLGPPVRPRPLRGHRARGARRERPPGFPTRDRDH